MNMTDGERFFTYVVTFIVGVAAALVSVAVGVAASGG